MEDIGLFFAWRMALGLLKIVCHKQKKTPNVAIDCHSSETQENPETMCQTCQTWRNLKGNSCWGLVKTWSEWERAWSMFSFAAKFLQMRYKMIKRTLLELSHTFEWCCTTEPKARDGEIGLQAMRSQHVLTRGGHGTAWDGTSVGDSWDSYHC